MQTKLLMVSVMMITLLAGCSGKTDSGSASSGGPMVAFVKTQDGSPLEIKASFFDTAQAKEFSSTGKNPYIGNAEASAKGKKLFQMYSLRNVMAVMLGAKQGLVSTDQTLSMLRTQQIKACLKPFGTEPMAVWAQKVKV
jgi:hypothetical protein